MTDFSPWNVVSHKWLLPSEEHNNILDHGLEKTVSYIIRKNGSVYEAIQGGGATGAGTIAYGGAANVGGATGSDFDAVINATVTAGKHIFVKAPATVLTWNTDSIPANKIIECEHQDYLVIKHSTPDTIGSYISVGSHTILMHLSVWDYGGINIGMSPNGARPLNFYYNGRNSSTNYSGWYRQHTVVDIGEPDSSDPPTYGGNNWQYDRPGIGVNQYGPGDAFYAGVKETGVGFRADVCLNGAGVADPTKWGTGVFIVYGAGYSTLGRGLFVVAKSGSTGYPVLLTAESNVPMITLAATADTTTDIDVVTAAKTTGQQINLYHSTSNFSGVGITMNYAVGSGTFSGFFVQFKNNSLERFKIVNTGQTYISKSGVGDFLGLRVDGDTVDRATFSDNEIAFGDGSSPVDTNLYRISANNLKTDDTLQAAGYKSSDGSAGLTTTQTFKDDAGTTKTLTIKNGLITGIA
jgi:hypothetical protein